MLWLNEMLEHYKDETKQDLLREHMWNGCTFDAHFAVEDKNWIQSHIQCIPRN